QGLSVLEPPIEVSGPSGNPTQPNCPPHDIGLTGKCAGCGITPPPRVSDDYCDSGRWRRSAAMPAVAVAPRLEPGSYISGVRLNEGTQDDGVRRLEGTRSAFNGRLRD